MALAIALSQLSSLVPVVTEPAVSVFDRAFRILLLLSALSLFTLGLSRLRSPEWFDDGAPKREFRSLPLAIIAGGLFGIGVLSYMIVL